MIRTSFVYALLFSAFLFSCEKETSLAENEWDSYTSGAWMIDGYTFENDADFKIGFVKGAGVSALHELIFYGYKDRELVEDETLYWQVDSKTYPSKEIEKAYNTKYYYSSGGGDYYGKNVQVDFIDDGKVVFTKENIYIPKPIKVNFTLNGKLLESDGASHPTFNPEDDILELEWNNDSHDSKLILMLITPPTGRPVPPCYHTKEVDELAYKKDIRYIFLEDKGKLTIDQCLFNGIKEGLVYLSLSRGNLHEFTENNKKFTVYDLSRDAISLKVK